jgi:hypothetical protein
MMGLNNLDQEAEVDYKSSNRQQNLLAIAEHIYSESLNHHSPISNLETMTQHPEQPLKSNWIFEDVYATNKWVQTGLIDDPVRFMAKKGSHMNPHHVLAMNQQYDLNIPLYPSTGHGLGCECCGV